jgi:hypothetical protein
MKNDRELIQLAKTKRPDAIARQMQRPPETIIKMAAKLGLKIKQPKVNE